MQLVPEGESPSNSHIVAALRQLATEMERNPANYDRCAVWLVTVHRDGDDELTERHVLYSDMSLLERIGALELLKDPRWNT